MEPDEGTGVQGHGVKWVDLNKGDLVALNYRSRLIVKELKAFTP